MVELREMKYKKDLEHPIPLDKIKEITIGKTSRYVPFAGEAKGGYYFIGAKMIILWEDVNGVTQYDIIEEENQQALDYRINLWTRNQVTLFVTGLNIGPFSRSDFEQAYNEIEKEPYTGQPIEVTDYSREDITLWNSPYIQKKREEKYYQLRPLIKKGYALIILMNFLVAFLWMPKWKITDGAFANNTYFIIISLINIGFLFFVYSWRKSIKWYFPLFDITLIITMNLLGLATSKLYSDTTNVYFTAMLTEGAVFGIILMGLYLIRLYTLKKYG